MANMDVDHSSTSALAQASLPPELSNHKSDTLSDVLEVVRLTGALFFLVDARHRGLRRRPRRRISCPSSCHLPSMSSRTMS